MTGALLFYLITSTKNRVTSAVKRLRQPKYLFSALVGLGYLYFAFFRSMFNRSSARGGPPIPFSPDMLPLIETGAALVLVILVFLPWVWPGRGSSGLRFTEAEIQFLFPAPFSHRTLVHFRLIKMQIGIFFGVVLSFVIFGRGRFLDHPFFFLGALWGVYSFLGLYSLGTYLVQTSLAEHGLSGFKRQIWTLGALAAVAVSVVVWVRRYLPPLPQGADVGLHEISAWVVQLTESGPAYFLTYPFKALVRPAFAADPAAFALRFVPAVVIVALVYVWVIYTDVSFEEASLERARKMAARIEAARSGNWRGARGGAPKVRRPLFQLAASGFGHTPIFWKNLISVGRLGSMRVLPALIAIGVAVAAATAKHRGEGQVLLMIIGTITAAFAAFLTVLGPMMIRDDLRSDLLQMELLKTYPLPGWTIVLGEVLMPSAVLAAIQWVLLLVAAVLIPAIGSIQPTFSLRVLVGLSAALLLPCFSMIGVLIQNAVALIWPGWIELGKANRRGIEAMGQRLITMVATLLTLIVAVIPAAIIFGIIYFLGSMVIGITVMPIAALAAALSLLAEAGFAILWLGHIFEKFDVSRS
jgi:ABC-2 type transport system permease protein